MAEKKSSRKGREDKADQPTAEAKQTEEAKKDLPSPPVKPAVRVAQLTFTRWFNSMVQKGKYKPHHKAGMLVFIGGNPNVRHSADKWNKLFEKY